MKNLIVLFAIVAVSLLVGCATMNNDLKTPKGAYLEALTQFDNLLELYLQNLGQIDDDDLRAKIKDAFEKGELALKAWKAAIEINSDLTGPEKDVDAALNVLIELMFDIVEEVE